MNIRDQHSEPHPPGRRPGATPAAEHCHCELAAHPFVHRGIRQLIGFTVMLAHGVLDGKPF